jgi:2-keto-4-pentenoate hydratase/2-oxohepta-3-ene-1,7-dioic acid hydratase in catechol pathway
VIAVRPSKIVCVGRNYVAHAQELGNEVPAVPMLFFKPPSALIGPGETIVMPETSRQVEYEAEIGVVIGSRLRGATEADAERGIGG